MAQKIRLLFYKYLNEDLDLRVQIFNVLALTGIVLGVFTWASGFFTNAGPANMAVNLGTAVFGYALLRYSGRSGNYKRCYILTVVVVFIVAFPVLFFTAGGYHSGMPAFFIFGVVLTIFMLEGKKRFVLSAVEIVIYIGVCVIAYRCPQSVSFFTTERDTLVDIIIGFSTVSMALALTVLRHTLIYDRKQQQLAQANEALNKVNRMRTEFLGNVSHELKTPLTVISGYAQESGKILATQPGLAELERSMKLIASEADRLALMVSQVLDVTRIDEGRMVFDWRPTPLAQIVQNTLQSYYPVFSKNNNTLELERGGDTPTVLCDQQRIAQVLVNLIGNASRHTHDGKIIIGLKTAGAFAEVLVRDTGEGIAKDRLPFLFERFKSYPEHKEDRTGKDTGTGLGLFICKYIIEEHGGQIEIQSEPGQGTEVRFTLPLQS